MRRAARYLLYAVSGAVVALFLVGYAARYVHPQYAWWAELVAIGLPYLTFAVAGCMAAAVALQRWRLLAVLAAMGVLAIVRFGLPLPLQGADAEADDLRILTFNVPRWGGLEMEAKTERLRGLVDAAEPDLVALQESFTDFGEGGALAGNTRPYVRALASAPLDYRFARGTQTDTHQPILSRGVSLRDLSQQTLKVGSQAQDITYVVRAGFEWQGRPAVFYNVHLRSFGSDKPWRAENPHLFDFGFWKPYLRQYRDAYRARAREVKRIQEMLAEETDPVIVAGDFNSTPHSWAYRQLAADMQDAFHLGGSGWGSTYHARLPFARIDFVLASEEWDIVSARVPDADLSDHRPLLATLRWRE